MDSLHPLESGRTVIDRPRPWFMPPDNALVVVALLAGIILASGVISNFL